MKPHAWLLLVLALCPTLVWGRTWTSREGKKIEADFVAANGESVTVKRDDGKQFTIKLAALSNDDQRFVRDLLDPELVALIDSLEPATVENAEKRYAGLSEAQQRASAHALALIYTHHGKYTEALAKLQPAAASDAESLGALRLQLWLACATNDQPTSLKLFESVSKRYKNNAEGVHTARLIGKLSALIRSRITPLEAKEGGGKDFILRVAFLEQQGLYAEKFKSARKQIVSERKTLASLVARLQKIGEGFEKQLANDAAAEQERLTVSSQLERELAPLDQIVSRWNEQFKEPPAPVNPGEPRRPRKLTNDEREDYDRELEKYEEYELKRKYYELDVAKIRALKNDKPAEVSAAEKQALELRGKLAEVNRTANLSAARDLEWVSPFFVRFSAGLPVDRWSEALDHPAAYDLLDFAEERKFLQSAAK